MMRLSNSTWWRIISNLYACNSCGRTWREWYGLSARELHESMVRHEQALPGHSVHYVGERAIA